MNKKDNPLSAYVIAGHLAFVVAAPLLFFIWGGTWLADRLDWADWIKIVLVLLGVFSMLGSLIGYFRNLITLYGGRDSEKPPVSRHKDYYYDKDYRVKKPMNKDSNED
jgi:hypothetical protein